MQTTLNQIQSHKPCVDIWEKLLKNLGKTEADDAPLLISTIIKSNGLDDALWCLRAVEGYNREIRLFVVWCAQQVKHLMPNQRSRDALDVAEKYAHQAATSEELEAAWAVAWDAAHPAALDHATTAAWGAAWGATRVDVQTVAQDAARDAAWAAAWDVARAAAWGDAWGAAWGDARDAQQAELLRICLVTEAALRQSIAEAEQDHTYGYAKGLAEAIFKQHFASDEHYASGRIVWGVNDTVIGILTQIDNMVAGMVRKPEAEQVQEPFEYWNAVEGWVTVTQDEVIDGRALQRMRQEAYKRTDTQYRDDPEVMFAKGFEAGFSSRTTPPQRKPLTPQSPCEMTQAEYKMFKLGWLECEAAHGITKGEV